MTATRSNLTAALHYAARHLPVFPCVANGKQPAIPHGFRAATTNPETIRRLWRQADCNVGIPTGAVSGFWVLDVDGEVGAANLKALEAKHGPLPATRTVITGSGRHLWFRYSGPIPCSTGRIRPGLDSRGDGGYVIAPPSIHPNGRRYEFLSHDELADAPQWLERLARSRKISERALEKITAGIPAVKNNAYGSAALEREIEALAAALPGTRNSALNSAAFKLFQLVAGGELDDAEVYRRLVEACQRNGLIEDDGIASVLATIRSARAGLKFPRSRSGGA